MLRLLPYLVLIFASAVTLVTSHSDPALLRTIAREDGPVEWLTVLALLLLAGLLFRDLRALGSTLRPWQTVGGWLLFAFALFAAGEEISWGQRLFGWETGEKMQELNLQNETNLHNLIPPLLFNGLIIFALGIGFVLAPLVWRSVRKEVPDWLPSRELSLLMLAAILINHYDFGHPIEWFGLGLLLVLLAQQTVSAALGRRGPEFAACLGAWLTAIIHYTNRHVLREANHQYEIRELLIVVIAVLWAKAFLDRQKALKD